MDVDKYKEKLAECASLLNQLPSDANQVEYAKFGNNVRLLLEENYEIYINTNDDERKEIRQIIKDHDRSEKHVYEGGPLPNPFRYVLNGYSIQAIKQLEETGDSVWVWRGLVAISMLDGIHYRPDDEEHLARLYVAAEEKGINPKPIYQQIAKISNNRPTKQGQFSTSELIESIPSMAHKLVDEFRKMFTVDKENE